LKIKRYVVREMQEAIRLIKQDLGSEAVIVSSYKVPAKGLIGLFSPRLLEVTAALDEASDIKVSVDCPPAQMAMRGANTTERVIGPFGNPAEVFSLGAGAEGLQDGNPGFAGSQRSSGFSDPGFLLRQMRGEPPVGGRQAAEKLSREAGEGGRLFEKLVSQQVEAGLSGDTALRWRRTLLEMDIHENIVERLISVLFYDENGRQAIDFRQVYYTLQNQVASLLEPAYYSRDSARIFTFVGPPGVGKTTTLAKLATRLSLNDHKKIALVAVNSYRIGSVEQIRAYGDFLGIPVEVVMTPSELARALEEHVDKDAVLIDTAGRSARNVGQVLELKGFLDAVDEPQDIFLVLSMASKNKDLARAAHEYRKIGYTKFIFTQLDETETHGSIMNLVYGMGVPAAYLSDGQRIPDDISEAGPKKIAKILFRGVDPDETVAT